MSTPIGILHSGQRGESFAKNPNRASVECVESWKTQKETVKERVLCLPIWGKKRMFSPVSRAREGQRRNTASETENRNKLVI